MRFEEINKHRKKYPVHYANDRYYGNYRGHYSHNMPDREHYFMYVLNKIWSNRKLRLLFVLFALIAVVLIIVLAIMSIPLIIKVLNTITESGLKGITESITGFVDKIWNGTVN